MTGGTDQSTLLSSSRLTEEVTGIKYPLKKAYQLFAWLVNQIGSKFARLDKDSSGMHTFITLVFYQISKFFL